MTAMVMTTILLALAWFATMNLVTSAMVWTAAAALRRSAAFGSAGVLVAARLFPAAASLLLTLVIFVPVHWVSETRGTNESFGWILFVAAGAGALLIVRGGARAMAVARADRRLRAGERASSAVCGVTESPDVSGLALAGLMRTRIVLAPRVAAALTRPEMDAAIAHELAHRRAFDNLKRCAFYCAPDFFGSTRVARDLERGWHAAAESLADARAAGESEQRAVDLASALIKVSRLTSVLAPARSPVWSTFNDPALLRERVHHLTSGTLAAPPCRPGRACWAAIAVVASLAMLVPLVSGAIHALTEAAVAFLP
jgi:beta-lactamase regulating signal transducer with metallopeptidase domain